MNDELKAGYDLLAHDNMRYKTLDMLRDEGIEPDLRLIADSMEGFYWNPVTGISLCWQDVDDPAFAVYKSPATGNYIEVWTSSGTTPQYVADVLEKGDFVAALDANWASVTENSPAVKWHEATVEQIEAALREGDGWLHVSYEWWKRKDGLDLERALAAAGAEIPEQLMAVHDDRLSRFTGTKIAAAAMDMGWCDKGGIQPEDEVVAVAVVTKSMIREMATELGYNEVREADIAEFVRYEFSPDGVWENAFCLDRVEAALGESAKDREADLAERDHAAQDERLDGDAERD